MTTKLKTTWNGNMKGNGTIKSDRLDTPIAIPNSLGGTGDGTDCPSSNDLRLFVFLKIGVSGSVWGLI